MGVILSTLFSLAKFSMKMVFVRLPALIPFSFLLPPLYSAIAYIIPALLTTRTVLHPTPAGVTQWLSYWSILILLEFTFFPLLHLFYSSFPLYITCLKCLLAAYLSFPHYSGATSIHRHLLAPIFATIESDVDSGVTKVRGAALRLLLTVLYMSIKAGIFGAWSGVLASFAAYRYGPLDDSATTSGGWAFSSSSSEPTAHFAARPRNPSHSLREDELFTTSSRTQSGNDDDAPDAAFVRDFLALLSRGLFVFSRAHPSKTVKLSVLSFLLSSPSSGGGKGEAYALTPEVLPTPSLLFAAGVFTLSVVNDLPASAPSSALPPPSALLPLSRLSSCTSLGSQGLRISLSSPSLHAGTGGISNEAEEELEEVADVTLADEGDRDILLQGIIMVLKYVRGGDDERMRATTTTTTTTNCERAQALT